MAPNKTFIAFLSQTVGIFIAFLSFTYWMGAKVNHLESVANQMSTIDTQLGLINRTINNISINSQHINNLQSQLNQINIQVGMLERNQANIPKSYIDKEYYYRNMDIIKGDFRTDEDLIHKTSNRVGYIEGLLQIGPKPLN